MKKPYFDPIRLLKTGVLLTVTVLTAVFRAPLLKAAATLAYTAATMQLPAAETSLPQTPSAVTTPSVPDALVEEVVSAVLQNSVVSQPQSEPEGKPIREMQLVAGEDDVDQKGVTLSNKSDVSVDIAAALSKEPVIDLVRNGRPQVL
ncbi:MAG: hypothetical protein IJC25_05855, partial [Clostridia bacterium]|nr:hypothetical protein [Clostridia bacterium]